MKLKLDHKHNQGTWYCTKVPRSSYVQAVVGEVDGDKNGLSLPYLHLLKEQDWEACFVPQEIQGTLRDSVLAYIREQFPDCDKVVAPLRVGCNNILYDAKGILAEGHRVTEAELDAMLAKVRELKAEAAKEKEAGKQRVWWSQVSTEHNGMYKKGYRDNSVKYETLADWKNIKCGEDYDYSKFPWRAIPVDAEGNEIEVRWRAKNSEGVLDRACPYDNRTRQSAATRGEVVRQIGNLWGWGIVPVAADDKTELDLRLGGATWEPAA